MSQQRLKTAGALVLMVGFLSLSAPSAGAADISWNGDPIRKLGRGLANAAGGIFEIPLAVSKISQEEGPLAGIFLGTCYGFGAAVTRSGVGIVEIFTFPFPLPEVGYGPILQPEFLFHP